MLFICLSFNTQPPEGGWVLCSTVCTTRVSFNTQPPEGGWTYFSNGEYSDCDVSTHSRPKAAGVDGFDSQAFRIGFNTQPPEGGWSEQGCLPIMFSGFNTQPPEGGWN